MGDLYHSIFVQQGSSQTLRVSNQTAYMVIDEAWQARGMLLNTTIRATFQGTPEGKAAAEAEVARIKKEKDW